MSDHRRAPKTVWEGWTQENLTTLTEMIKAGSSSRQIATALHCTRSGVCGKAHRMGLSVGGGTPEGRRISMGMAGFAHRVQVKQPKPMKTPKPAPQPKPQLAVERPPVIIGEPLLLKITDPGFCGCRWPIDGDGTETRFCCLPTQQVSYCPGHTLASVYPRTAAQKQARIKGLNWILRRAA